jgi:hypothetical protein
VTADPDPARPEPPLPPLQDVVLDDAELAQLAFDVEHAAELLAVIARPIGARRAAAAGACSLDDAVRALRGRSASVQLRYRHRGEEWWDTLIPTAAGVRLVRISRTRALADEGGGEAHAHPPDARRRFACRARRHAGVGGARAVSRAGPERALSRAPAAARRGRR